MRTADRRTRWRLHLSLRTPPHSAKTLRAALAFIAYFFCQPIIQKLKVMECFYGPSVRLTPKVFAPNFGGICYTLSSCVLLKVKDEFIGGFRFFRYDFVEHVTIE
eukprot:6182292-Pleurochrysis_carterae.AAC.1